MTKLPQFEDLKIKHFVIFLTILMFGSCADHVALTEISGKEIPITANLPSEQSVADFIQPYHDHVNQILDSALTYAPYKICKTDGAYNSTAGNLLADLLMQQVAPIFKTRTGKTVDFVMLNHGGIRSIISKGPVTSRTAYEVMPFENSVTVVELTPENIEKLVRYVIRSQRAQPFSGLQIVLKPDGSLDYFKIQGKPLDLNRNYYVATSDYLSKGGDEMSFFNQAISITDLNYKIRNAMIDYFMKIDTLKPTIDKRFYKLN